MFIAWLSSGSSMFTLRFCSQLRVSRTPTCKPQGVASLGTWIHQRLYILLRPNKSGRDVFSTVTHDTADVPASQQNGTLNKRRSLAGTTHHLIPQDSSTPRPTVCLPEYLSASDLCCLTEACQHLIRSRPQTGALWHLMWQTSRTNRGRGWQR